MILFTSAHVSNSGSKIALNPSQVTAIFTEFENETRIIINTGEMFLVSEPFDEVVSAIGSRL